MGFLANFDSPSHLHLLATSAMMSTLAAHSQWENETSERTGHQPSYAEGKKMEVANTSYPWLPKGLIVTFVVLPECLEHPLSRPGPLPCLTYLYFRQA